MIWGVRFHNIRSKVQLHINVSTVFAVTSHIPLQLSIISSLGRVQFQCKVTLFEGSYVESVAINGEVLTAARYIRSIFQKDSM